MFLTKRQFKLKNQISDMTCRSLLNNEIIVQTIDTSKKRNKCLIKASDGRNLLEGEILLTCKECGERVFNIASHVRKHQITKEQYLEKFPGSLIYSNLYLINKKKTEEEKKAQSEKLKKRFKTKEGEITRQQIAEASRRNNSDPEFLARKSENMKEVNNRPGVREKHSKISKKMWEDPEYRKKIKKLWEDPKRKEHGREHAFKYLLNNNGSSKLHLAFKRSIEEAGIKGFITEHKEGYYSIDEAHPRLKIAVEVHGCYWHGCEKCGYIAPHNTQRIDKSKKSYLENRGWRLEVFWEHDLKDMKMCVNKLKKIVTERKREKIKEHFKNRTLFTKSSTEDGKVQLSSITEVMRHTMPEDKDIWRIQFETCSHILTGDHSLFVLEQDKIKPIESRDLKEGEEAVFIKSGKATTEKVQKMEKIEHREHMYDISVPGDENFVLTSGLLAHNSYSISGISLDLERSSKYAAIADAWQSMFEMSLEKAKRTVKLSRGLIQRPGGAASIFRTGALYRSWSLH